MTCPRVCQPYRTQSQRNALASGIARYRRPNRAVVSAGADAHFGEVPRARSGVEVGLPPDEPAGDRRHRRRRGRRRRGAPARRARIVTSTASGLRDRRGSGRRSTVPPWTGNAEQPAPLEARIVVDEADHPLAGRLAELPDEAAARPAGADDQGRGGRPALSASSGRGTARARRSGTRRQRACRSGRRRRRSAPGSRRASSSQATTPNATASETATPTTIEAASRAPAKRQIPW